MTKTAYLGLGCNLGDRKALMKKAVELLAESPGVIIEAKSSLYETEPWGLIDQPAYYNAVLKIRTVLEPLDLLSACQEVEKALGRQRELKWGPRTMDIDILLYEDEVWDLPRLKIPHPYLTERVFVLMPLLELNPTVFIPGIGLGQCCIKSLPNKGISLLAHPQEW